MDVYWLEQTEADLPNGATGVPCVDNRGQSLSRATPEDGCATRPELEWLSARELVQLNAMRFAKRRADWQLGRWTAKHAVAACLQLPADLHNLAKIEVRADPSGAPETFLGNKWAPITISLSHRAGSAICAVAPDHGALGCDLELIEPHSDAFIADYFATEEQALVARAAPADRPWLATLLWSAKESALKALRVGLRLDTRRVIVTAADALVSQNDDGKVSAQEEDAKNPHSAPQPPDDFDGWRPLTVRHTSDQTFLGWWQHSNNLLRTIVAAPPPGRPLLLSIRRGSANSPSAVGSDQSQAT